MKLVQFMADIFGTNAAETLTGTSQNDRLYGLDGDDKLKGGAGSDELYGGAGNDTLWGDAGADLMFGGSGNDTYYVDDVGDVVSEQQVAGIDDGGIDRVYSTVTYTLGAFLERATLTGTFSGDLTGNDIANVLTGNDAANTLSGGGGIDDLVGGGGNDVLIGGVGKDNLTGGTGSDTFVFGAADATSTDSVKDFSSEDFIRVAADNYGLTLGNGLVDSGSGTLVLDPAYFATISGIGNAQGTVSGHGQFLFNTTTLTLMWDADGAGSGAAGIAIATFNVGTVLNASSFTITPPLPVVGNISIGDVTITEGDSGTRTATFTVSRTGTVGFSIDYATVGGSANAGSDYQSASGTLTFATGQLFQTITVTINGDMTFEPNETFFLNLFNPTNGGVIIDADGLGTILNDDAPPAPVGEISVGDVTITEGNSGTQTVTFTVTRTSTAPFSVDFATADGTAIAGSDYSGTSGTLIFADGQMTQTISVTVNGDTAFELNETFFLNLTNASNGGVIIDNQAVGTIINDDGAPPVGDISVTDVTIVEGDNGSQTVIFTVSRTGTAAFSVDFATANGTASAGSDYTATSGTLTFAPGQLTRTVTVTVFGDVTFEANETFFLNLANATPGGVIVDNQGVATILNDDVATPIGAISVSDVSVVEGDSGTRSVTFTVSRTGTSAFSIDFATADGTATGGRDYVANAGTLTFAEGQLSRTVTVTINGDMNFENNETFFLNLFNASYGANLLDYQGLATIFNNDASPLYFDINGTSSNEDLTGDAGANRIYGFAGQDRLYGKAGADLLYGGAGNDRLDGGTGVDTMFGGSGDDLYRVDELGDVVNEESGASGIDDGGIDTVESAISYTLGAFIEKLTLTGASTIDATGNSLANTIKGNDAANVLSGMAGDDDLRGNGGDDTLIGGSGKDTLTGGTGADVFVFGTADANSTDRVVDFTSGTDRLRFYASDYGLSEGSGLIGGALDPTYFAVISGTQNQGTVSGHGQFLYNTTSRTLFWDADGAGTGTSGVAIATFSAVNSIPVTLNYSDLTIFNGLPVVSVANSSAVPATEGQQAYFVISLSAAATEDVYIRYSTTGGTATSGVDFTGSTDNFAIIRAGTMSVVVGVSLATDTVFENVAETFNLQVVSATLVNGTNLVLGVNQTTGFIADEPNHIVNVISTMSLRSVDPSGLAYVPGIGLFISDSEVEEGPFYRTNNLFRIQTDGTAPAQFSMLNFTSEPTGLTFDNIHNRLYMTDDDRYKVFWVDPANPTVKLGEFSVPLAADDPEDIAFNPNTGTLFISNGLSHSIVEVDANGNQVGATVILPGNIIIDPEALAYDAQHDVFYVSGGFSHLIWKVDRSGNIIDTIDVLAGFTNPVSGTSVHIKDMVFAPTSDPNDDPSLMSLYVADYGNTHLTPALTDDGRIIEIFINGAPTDPGYWV
jgi:Ca2+-binding RTX toxin-like protein